MKDWVATLREQQQRADDLRRDLVQIDAQRAEKAAELATIENRMREAFGILSGQAEPAAKAKSRHGFVGGKRSRPIQHGSSVWWSAKVLHMLGKPLHIKTLISWISKESGEEFKPATLVSNLTRYVRYGDTFTRPAPNTFGLIDFSLDIDAQTIFEELSADDEEDESK
jgi:hypothetical protein